MFGSKSPVMVGEERRVSADTRHGNGYVRLEGKPLTRWRVHVADCRPNGRRNGECLDEPND
jgi:hypothetical protein